MSLVVNLKQSDTGLVCRTDNTNRFYNDIRKYDVLTREEETKLFKKLSEYKRLLQVAKKSGDLNACEMYTQKIDEVRNFIISANQRLCVSAAKNWATTDTLLDYINEANIDLAEAVDKFDYTKGFKFASYAMWYIKRALNDYRNKTLPIVRKTNGSKTWNLVSKITNDFVQKNERNPTSDELFELVNERLKSGIKDKFDLLTVQLTPINDYVGDEEIVNHSDIADYNNVSASENDYEKETRDDFQKELVSSLLNTLSERERKIISMKFGLITVNGIKREFESCEIASELGITPERVRQIEAEVLKKLKTEYDKKVFSYL